MKLEVTYFYKFRVQIININYKIDFKITNISVTNFFRVSYNYVSLFEIPKIFNQTKNNLQKIKVQYCTVKFVGAKKLVIFIDNNFAKQTTQSTKAKFSSIKIKVKYMLVGTTSYLSET